MGFDFASTGFILVVLWYVLFYLLTMSSNLSANTFFWYWSYFFEKFIFQVLWNYSPGTDFPSLWAECISLSLSCIMISLIYCKMHCLYLPMSYFVCVLMHLQFLKSIDNFNTFFIFQKKDPCIFTINMNSS